MILLVIWVSVLAIDGFQDLGPRLAAHSTVQTQQVQRSLLSKVRQRYRAVLNRDGLAWTGSVCN